MGFRIFKAKRLSVACGIVASAVRPAIISLLSYCAIQPLEAASCAGGQKFRADEWITECDPSTRSDAPDCSITVPFWQTSGDPKGSFALVVMLQTGNIGIVGEPPPVRAVLRVDKTPPVECRQPRYCVFPGAQALAILRQLKVGSLILIDVDTEKGSPRIDGSFPPLNTIKTDSKISSLDEKGPLSKRPFHVAKLATFSPRFLPFSTLFWIFSATKLATNRASESKIKKLCRKCLKP